MKPLIQIMPTLLFILLVHCSFAQVWPKYYSQNNSYDYSEDIIETYDNGYLLSGNYSTYNGMEYKTWSWLIKTDINGNILWDKIIEGGDQIMETNAIEQTQDGGIFVCGWIWTEIGKYDPYVMKINTCGEKEWCTIFASSTMTNPWAQDIKETVSGDIIVLVNQYEEDNVEDMHLFKLNSLGGLLWKEAYCKNSNYPASAFPLGASLSITSENNYTITGSVYWANPWNPGGAKGLRPLFVMVDSIGTEKWVLPFGLNDTIYGHANNTIQLSDDNFISVGRAFGEQVDREGLIMKFDNLGNELDYNQINFQTIDTSFKVGLFWDIIKKDSIYILASFFDSDPNGQAPPGELIVDTNQLFSNFTVNNYSHYLSNDDPYNVFLSKDGKIISNSVFEEPNNWDIALSKLNLNLEYDTLYPGNYTYDSLCTIPGLPQSGFIFLDDCDIITGIDVPSPEEYYAFLKTIPTKAFPNPTTTGEITLEYENTEHHDNMELKCFDIYGRPVHKEKLYRHQGKSIVNVSGWQKGMYVAVVYSEGLPVGECKFVVQ